MVYEDQCSQLRQIKVGLLQGSVLGPLLYLMYTFVIQVLKLNANRY